MSILSNLRAYFATRRDDYDDYRTRRILTELPAEIQKDIGYPARYESARARAAAARR